MITTVVLPHTQPLHDVKTVVPSLKDETSWLPSLPTSTRARMLATDLGITRGLP